jgi:hypothetical protein
MRGRGSTLRLRERWEKNKLPNDLTGVRHYAKYFTCTILLTPHNNPIRHYYSHIKAETKIF